MWVQEMDIFHIILRCPVLLNAFSFFEPILKQVENQDISEKEICFGLFESALSIEQNLRNFITFHIRSATFRLRNTDFDSITAATKAVTDRTSKEIRKDLVSKFIISSKSGKLESFKARYLFRNILGDILDRAIVFKI